jgi:hypothetical protein
VILKPSPLDVQALYVRSLEAIGIDLSVHDLRFEEDNWEAPTLGAWGVGWQVMLDGMEITQFTYFQQAGGLDLAPIPAEITYGLERITMFLGCEAIYDIEWVPGGPFPTARCATRTRRAALPLLLRARRRGLPAAQLRRLGARGEALPRARAELVLPAYEAR